MYRHLKLRMYPNNFQKVMIDKSFGYTYSHYLVEKKYENLTRKAHFFIIFSGAKK